ncbi:Protein of unknown function [Arthrobacter sp. cf158]|nr:Protein of unknown function [Arthrobacter sp. cf158]
MKTLSTPLPGLLSELPQDRPARAGIQVAPSGEPETTQRDEPSEYELEHNDLERFDVEDEFERFVLGFDELAEFEDGRLEEGPLGDSLLNDDALEDYLLEDGPLEGGSLEDDGFWTMTRTKAGLMGSEVGMATAEYAIATLAAVGLAGLLVVILRSEEVRGFLLNLIRTALSLP